MKESRTKTKEEEMGEKNDVLAVPFGIKATMAISFLFIIVLLLGRFGNKKEKEEKLAKEVIPELVSAPGVNNNSSASTLTINETKGVETNGITEFRGIKTNLTF